jgi:Fur family ferric uptake transcriptional regulator
MDELQAVMDRARQLGLRMTRQRVAILQALCELGGHASAENVYEQATLHRRDVDLSTVYRTLERFRELRILSRTDLGRGCGEYEVVADQPHHHLVCQGCGQVTDLDHAYLAASAEAIRRDFGFEPIFDHFAIFGWCRDCRRRGDGRELMSRDREAEAKRPKT